MPIFPIENQRTIECMARWRPPGEVEPPAWVRAYDPAAWPNIYAWTTAADDWFDVNQVDWAARWAWILAIPDEPWPANG
jgi:hypothetical protein